MQRKKKKSAKRRNNKEGSNGSFKGWIVPVPNVPKWRKSGRMKPRSGADMTVRQVINGLSFATKTGMSGGSNTVFVPVTTGVAGVFNHTLNDMPQVASLVALYDQYRFEEIEIHFYPLSSQLTTTNTATNISGCSQAVLDFDDGTALASENAALEYENCQTFMPYDHLMIRYKPAISPAYWTGGAFTGYGVQPADKEWIDAASPSVVHFGTKYWFGASPLGSTLVAGWNVYGQYTVSFRNIR